MSLLHERWRTRVSLLAAGRLDERRARGDARPHGAGARPAGASTPRSRALLEAFARTRRDGAELPIPLAVPREPASRRASTPTLASRPCRWAELDPSAGDRRGGLARGGGARGRLARTSRAPKGPAAPAVAMSDDALRRLERTVAREQAVRYLNEAQDVLVTVAATPRACDRDKARVDVGEEARRSRELLARRALLVELDDEGVAERAPVLEDVEHVLREVASLESCARARDVERVHSEIEEQAAADEDPPDVAGAAGMRPSPASSWPSLLRLAGPRFAADSRATRRAPRRCSSTASTPRRGRPGSQLLVAGGPEAETAAYWVARCSENLKEDARALKEYGDYLARRPADPRPRRGGAHEPRRPRGAAVQGAARRSTSRS